MQVYLKGRILGTKSFKGRDKNGREEERYMAFIWDDIDVTRVWGVPDIYLTADFGDFVEFPVNVRATDKGMNVYYAGD